MDRVEMSEHIRLAELNLGAAGVPFDYQRRVALREASVLLSAQPQQPTERKEVWIIEARHTTQDKPAVEIPILFTGTLQEATEQAVQYVRGMTAPITVSGIRRIGFAVEVPR